MEIRLALDRQLLDLGIKQPITWQPDKHSMILLMGKTGTGKTHMSRILTARLGMHGAAVTLCNYKASEDFSHLRDCPRYYEYDCCMDGLNDFYDRFSARLQGADTSMPLVLFFDEYSAFLNSLDKKAAEEAKRKMAQILAMGRSLRCFCIVSLQRGEAEYFSSNRDNFSIVVFLGQLSEQAKQMFFAEYKDGLRPVSEIGQGHALIDGKGLKCIQVERIPDENKLRAYIRKAVTQM